MHGNSQVKRSSSKQSPGLAEPWSFHAAGAHAAHARSAQMVLVTADSTVGQPRPTHLRISGILKRVKDLLQRNHFARLPVDGLPNNAVGLCAWQHPMFAPDSSCWHVRRAYRESLLLTPFPSLETISYFLRMWASTSSSAMLPHNDQERWLLLSYARQLLLTCSKSMAQVLHLSPASVRCTTWVSTVHTENKQAFPSLPYAKLLC